MTIENWKLTKFRKIDRILQKKCGFLPQFQIDWILHKLNKETVSYHILNFGCRPTCFRCPFLRRNSKVEIFFLVKDFVILTIIRFLMWGSQLTEFILIVFSAIELENELSFEFGLWFNFGPLDGNCHFVGRLSVDIELQTDWSLQRLNKVSLFHQKQNFTCSVRTIPSFFAIKIWKPSWLFDQFSHYKVV